MAAWMEGIEWQVPAVAPIEHNKPLVAEVCSGMIQSPISLLLWLQIAQFLM